MTPEEIRQSDLKHLGKILHYIHHNRNKFYILDTETTGLNPCEVIEWAIVDLNGNILRNQRFNPYGKITHGAFKCHGITLDNLKDKGRFWECFYLIQEMLENRILLTYNADFDLNAIAYSIRISNPPLPISLNLKYLCLMRLYATYVGEKPVGWIDYKWQKLNGIHSAKGDCLRALEILNEMIKNVPLVENKREWKCTFKYSYSPPLEVKLPVEDIPF